MVLSPWGGGIRIVILVHVTWDVVVVLTCNSLMIKDIEHLFMYFLVIYICSLEKYLFRFIAH